MGGTHKVCVHHWVQLILIFDIDLIDIDTDCYLILMWYWSDWYWYWSIWYWYMILIWYWYLMTLSFILIWVRCYYDYCLIDFFLSSVSPVPTPPSTPPTSTYYTYQLPKVGEDFYFAVTRYDSHDLQPITRLKIPRSCDYYDTMWYCVDPCFRASWHTSEECWGDLGLTQCITFH